MNSKMELTFDHQDWLNPVMENDVEAVRLRLQQSNEDVKHLLLEGWICDDSFWACWPCKEAETQKIMTVHRPLGLAAVCGSCDVIQELYDGGIDMYQADKLGNTVIHTLIIHANRNQERELMYLDVFLKIKSLMSKDDFNRMLLTENLCETKPLELAAHFQTFRLMNAILTTPGVYLKKQAKCGTLSIDSYDVTDYESDTEYRPWVNSPMFLLIFLNFEKLKDDYTTKFITKGLIARWVNVRKNVYLPFIMLWAAVRLFSISLALFAAALGEPTDPGLEVCGTYIHVPKSMNTVAITTLIVLTTFALLYDLYDMIRVYRLNKLLMEKYTPSNGEKIVHYLFYRMTEAVLNVVLLTICLNKVIWNIWGYRLPVYPAQMLFVVMVCCSVWSLLFFVQLMPLVGIYVMATQRMLHCLTKFGVIILIFVLPFSFIFPKFISRKEDGTCPDEFDSTISSFYTSFTVILNMVDFRSFDAPSKESLWLIHVFYILLIAILLLNFLIAIFSDSFKEVADNPEVLCTIQWLSIIASIDFRLPRCMRSILHRLKRRNFVHQGNRIHVMDFRSCDETLGTRALRTGDTNQSVC